MGHLQQHSKDEVILRPTRQQAETRLRPNDHNAATSEIMNNEQKIASSMKRDFSKSVPLGPCDEAPAKRKKVGTVNMLISSTSLFAPVKPNNTRPRNATWCVGNQKLATRVIESPKLDESSPVALLRSVILSGKTKFVFDASYFSKPSQEDLQAYTSNTVSAIRSANIEKLKKMQQEGQSMNACNQFGESLLHMACRRGNPDVVKFLVEDAKVKTQVRDDYGRTVLHDACWTSAPNFEVMKILIENMPTYMLLAEDVRGHTPFDYARRQHWTAWNKFILEQKEKLAAVPSDDTVKLMKIVG